MDAVPKQASLMTPDRLAIMFGLAGVVLISWAYLIVEANRMVDMDMSMMSISLRSPVEFVLLFVMWTIMMVAMMLPSAMPMIMLQSALLKTVSQSQSFIISVLVFVLGYLVIWTVFSAAATLLQILLETTALLSPMMVSNSVALGGGLLITAGIYQFTGTKNTCLTYCKAPIVFASTYWQPGIMGSFMMGLRHGAFCVGCCWAIMVLLFVGGVMNLVWVAMISLFVLLEKLTATGLKTGRYISGAGLMVTGIWFIWI